MKATEVTAGLAESNGSLLPGLWRDSLHVTCGLTAYTPGSAPGPTLGNEYGKTFPFYLYGRGSVFIWRRCTTLCSLPTVLWISPRYICTYINGVMDHVGAYRYRCSECRHCVVVRRLTPLLRRIRCVVS